MKKFIISLKIVRKFGFIMALVMMFPYLGTFPLVAAAPGDLMLADQNGGGVSLSDMELAYQEQEEVLERDILIYDEIDPYVSVDSNGLLSVNIPDNTQLSITDEEVEQTIDSISMMNSLIDSGEAMVDSNKDIYLANLDNTFQLQAASNKFYIKYWKINLLLGQTEGIVFASGLFLLTQASNYSALYAGGASAIANAFVANTSATSFGLTTTFLSISPLGIAGYADAATFLYGLCVTLMAGNAIYNILSAAAPGIGTIVAIAVKALIAIGLNYVWGQIGSNILKYSFLAYRNRELDGDYNSRLSGVKLNCSLTLRRQKWYFQY
jgi:hypothetical protein